MKPVKRATENWIARRRIISVVRSCGLQSWIFNLYPALKCWAASDRLLRGLVQNYRSGLSSQTIFLQPVVKAFPQALQNRALGSFWTAPQAAHDKPARRLAPHAAQKVEPALAAAPQVPQRPGIGGT